MSLLNNQHKEFVLRTIYGSLRKEAVEFWDGNMPRISEIGMDRYGNSCHVNVRRVFYDPDSSEICFIRQCDGRAMLPIRSIETLSTADLKVIDKAVKVAMDNVLHRTKNIEMIKSFLKGTEHEIFTFRGVAPVITIPDNPDVHLVPVKDVCLSAYDEVFCGIKDGLIRVNELTDLSVQNIAVSLGLNKDEELKHQHVINVDKAKKKNISNSNAFKDLTGKGSRVEISTENPEKVHIIKM